MCGEMAAHTTFSPNTGWTRGFLASKCQQRRQKVTNDFQAFPSPQTHLWAKPWSWSATCPWWCQAHGCFPPAGRARRSPGWGCWSARRTPQCPACWTQTQSQPATGQQSWVRTCLAFSLPLPACCNYFNPMKPPQQIPQPKLTQSFHKTCTHIDKKKS